jgi:predicted nucleic-acid-binding Zn-ribbon protein
MFEFGEAWQKEVDEALEALNKRFPEISCLRCRNDQFFVRMWLDPSLVPAIADENTNRVVELTCKNCGLQERHLVRLLEKPQIE